MHTVSAKYCTNHRLYYFTYRTADFAHTKLSHGYQDAIEIKIII